MGKTEAAMHCLTSGLFTGARTSDLLIATGRPALYARLD